VDLPHDDPQAVEAMLQYLYKREYISVVKDNPNALLIHVRVYCLADKYEINALKGVAASLYEFASETDWQSPVFPIAIKEIYDNTESGDRALRDIAVNEAVLNIDSLLEDDNGNFAAMMIGLGEFGKDLVRALRSSNDTRPLGQKRMTTYCCANSCGQIWKINGRKTSQSFNTSLRCPGCCQVPMSVSQYDGEFQLRQCNYCKQKLFTVDVSYLREGIRNLYCPYEDKVIRRFTEVGQI